MNKSGNETDHTGIVSKGDIYGNLVDNNVKWREKKFQRPNCEPSRKTTSLMNLYFNNGPGHRNKIF